MPLTFDLEEDGCREMLAALVRTAIIDYQAGYTCPRHPDAGEFLRRAGLLDEHGQVSWRGQLVTMTGRHEGRTARSTPAQQREE